MRKLFFVSICISTMLSGMAQPALKMQMDSRNMEVTGYNWQRLRGGLAVNPANAVTVIDGEEILGIPFLYWDWQNGSISLVSGRAVSKYMLRYDVYHQRVLFLNGKDSMEVNEEIKEFSLMLRSDDSDDVGSVRFINGNQFKGNKDKNSGYYQVLVEDSAGQLLKFNSKEIKLVDKEMPLSAITEDRMFILLSSYYYYDKKKNILTRIKKNGSNIAGFLKLDQQKEHELSGYDFSNENELIRFFKYYFATNSSRLLL